MFIYVYSFNGDEFRSQSAQPGLINHLSTFYCWELRKSGFGSPLSNHCAGSGGCCSHRIRGPGLAPFKGVQLLNKVLHEASREMTSARAFRRDRNILDILSYGTVPNLRYGTGTKNGCSRSYLFDVCCTIVFCVIVQDLRNQRYLIKIEELRFKN